VNCLYLTAELHTDWIGVFRLQCFQCKHLTPACMAQPTADTISTVHALPAWDNPPFETNEKSS
jgi:hypothetical protein